MLNCSTRCVIEEIVKHKDWKNGSEKCGGTENFPLTRIRKGYLKSKRLTKNNALWLKAVLKEITCNGAYNLDVSKLTFPRRIREPYVVSNNPVLKLLKMKTLLVETRQSPLQKVFLIDYKFY